MELTRKQLYDMIWTDGVGKTEKALGLKQIELKTICEKFDIPRPSSGYWTSLKLGKPVQRTELSSSNNDTVTINTSDYITKKMSKKPPMTVKSIKDAEGKYQTRELPLNDQDVNPLYKVPDVLYAKDPIILDTKAKLRENNFRDSNPWNAKNPFKCKADKWLSMRVSQEQEDRAIRIYTTIINAAKARGYELVIEKAEDRYYQECTTYIVVRGHKIRTFLKEGNKYTTNDDGTINRHQTVGSGELKFECDEYEQHHRSSFTKCVAQDTKHSKIEDKIEHIIEVLEKVADYRDEWARQRKLEAERRQQEEEKRRFEEEERKRLQALQDEEFKRVQSLVFNAERLKLSKTIREYIKELQLHMLECGLSDDEIEWMKKKADFIDPFVSCSDELLTEEHIDKLLNPDIVMTDKSKLSYGLSHSEPQYSYWRIKNLWRK
ncbi:MAG: hypothetical protein IKV77_02320 [Alistipes sp.]|nr:hypothetical protein [Alistipes sp.]